MKGLLCSVALLLALGLLTACTSPTQGQPNSPTPNVSLTPGATPPTPNVTPTAGQPNSPTPNATPTPGATPPTPGETRLPTPQQKGVIVVYHPIYLTVYSEEAAARPGRIEAILKELQGVPGFIFTEPEPAKVEDIRRVHTQAQIDRVKMNDDGFLYQIALLSAGGAVLASEVAMAGEVSFGLIRPPGHHASPDSSWGFCYFNNIAVAVAKLLDEKKIQSALIVDFDLHFGDGTVNIFKDDPRVTYFNVVAQEGDRTLLLQTLEAFLSRTKGYDILAVSAGFDAGKEDWGRIFEIQDYTTMGTLLKRAAERNSGGKRFAVLEGGYNQNVLGKNVKAFLDGFR